ncbi:MAG: potassium transporter TrkG, partial [Pigmentiphaga sp.]
MKRLLILLNIMGFAMMLFAVTMLVPVGVAAYVDDGTLNAFLEAMLVALVAGAIPFFLTRSNQRELQARDGFLLVTLVWTLLPLLGSVPFLLYFAKIGEPISFASAYFEAMSGLTTTGATVLQGLDSLPPAINVWRATLMWIGGMGILVLAVAILPLLGVGGSQVVRAETPGPMKDEKLTPRIASTAKGLYAVYLGISLACWGAYAAAGMNPVDAYVHMAATVSLGGFSTYDASFSAFDSPLLEGIAIVFMTICAVSFATHFKAVRQRSAKAYWQCPEAR